MENLKKIDHAAIKTNQAVLIALGILAFVFNLPWLVIFVALVFALGTAFGKPGFGFIYRYTLKPLGWVKADIRMDNREPHLFSQVLGGAMMGAGGLALLTGAPIIGWVLVWFVIALASLNLFAGFCAGCMIYYWLTRLNAPGFHKSPPEGTFPGMRPDTRVYDEP
jgi:hypothetical protein